MIDFKSLETLLWVASTGSFNAAAQKLNTSQPNISQRIAALEADLGVKLLARETRTVTPTVAGREVLAYAEKIIGLRTEMLSVVRNREAIRGIVRVGVAETIVHTWLPRFITQVKQTYPGLSLEIEVNISPSLGARLQAQEIDLAFLLGAPATPGLRSLPLSDYRVAFVASPALGVPSPATLRDLAMFPVITFPRRTQPYELIKSIFNRADLPPVNLNTSASLATVVRLAIEGIGLAVIPLDIVRKELEEGALTLIETDVHVPDLAFSACWMETPDSLAVERVAAIALDIARHHGEAVRAAEA